MMACLNIREMQGYLEDAEAAGLRQKVERHLTGCQRCRGAFDRLAATNHRVNAWLSALASPMENAAVDIEGALARVTGREPTAAGWLVPAEVPWYVSLLRNVRDAVRPEKLPPLDITSKPVPVEDIWGLYANNPKNRLLSVGIHVALLSLAVFAFGSPQARQIIRQKIEMFDPNLKPYLPDIKPAARARQGGGGGGAREPLPVTKGQAPKPAARQFTPPMTVDHAPKLAMDPTLIAPPDTPLPQSNLNNWGDPVAALVNGSNGQGSGGGMGNGTGGGLGSGAGGGYGPGVGGGVGGAVFRAGFGGVSTPAVIFKADPEYSEEARKAKYSGTVVLSVIVDAEGRPRDVHVVRSLGMGLDEKAVEAVLKWRFKPGMKSGIAVNVRAQIEVNFRLL